MILERPIGDFVITVALSRDLKKQGWKFVGPTTVYAFMQAMGLINDHAGQFERPRGAICTGTADGG